MHQKPRLYKKTSTGAIQYWEISASEVDGSMCNLTVKYGQEGTKNPQETTDLIREGKNPGKKNATTAYEQGCKEADAKYLKHLKEGYVETIEGALAGEVHECVKGGIPPMLAHRYSEHAKKITFPCLGQVKFNGIRCIAIVKDGKCTLWSRERNQFLSLPHIEKSLESLGIDITLDGEAYNHQYKDNFEIIVSLVNQDTPKPNCTEVEYHVYDLVNTDLQHERCKGIASVISDSLDYIKVAEVVELNNQEEVDQFFRRARNNGYEGAMVRNRNGLYLNRKSYDLQKVKEFDDAEFKIIGINEGKGALMGHAATFTCLTAEGNTFEAKLKGSRSRLKEHYDNHSLWQGKLLTVQYQGFSTKDRLPIFPVGLAVRDYE